MCGRIMSVLHLCTWVHLVAVNVGAAVAAADAGERGDGVSVAVTVTGEESGGKQLGSMI